MTTQIGNHGLSCASDTDYAAIALMMQCNALATDIAISADNTALNAHLNRPWVSTTTSSAFIIADDQSGGVFGPGGVVGQKLFPATFNPTQLNVINFTDLYPAGIYLIGASINWTLTAATANSYRQLSVYGVRSQNGSTSTVTNNTDLYAIRDYQGDGGNNGALNVAGFLDNTAGNMSRVETFFSHANVASDLTVAAGNWRVWAMYLGSGLVI